MSLLHNDGFDHHGGTVAFLADYWSVVAGTSGMSLVTGLLGSGKALQCNTGTATSVVKIIGNTASLVVGFRFKIANLPTSTGTVLLNLNDGATLGNNQLSLMINTLGKLCVVKSGALTVLATSTNTIVPNAVYQVEFKATINSATGAYEVRVNGTSVGWIPAATNQNTRTTSNNFANYIELRGGTFGSAGGANTTFDDCYLFDTVDSPAGTLAKDFVGDSKIVTVFADSNDSVQWTANGDPTNHACVARNPPVDATNFVSDSTAGHIDLYNFTDLVGATSIVAATLVHRAAKSDAGARSIKSKVRSNSTNYDGSTFALSTTFLEYATVFSLDPATGLPWVLADLNNAKFGQENI